MIFKYVRHDLNEGILNRIKRLFLIVLLAVMVCMVADSNSEYYYDITGERFSVLEYIFFMFNGRTPYIIDYSGTQSFTIPFEWVFTYMILAYCMGDYIKKDLNGFGVLLLVKGKNRVYWWISKCIWCVVLNVCYFATLWLSVIGYSWVRYGEVSFDRHDKLMQMFYGDVFTYLKSGDYYMIIFVMPVLVGIFQSLLQMILALVMDSIVPTVITAAMLITSCYYGHRLIPHSYAMSYRYLFTGYGYSINECMFGLKYLLILCILMMLGGYFTMRRANILPKAQ